MATASRAVCNLTIIQKKRCAGLVEPAFSMVRVSASDSCAGVAVNPISATSAQLLSSTPVDLRLKHLLWGCRCCTQLTQCVCV